MYHFDVEKCKTQLAEHYQTSMSRVQRTPWNPDDTVAIDKIYTRLSWVKQTKKASGTIEIWLDEYTEVFKEREEDGLKPKRILVEGDAGMGKSTFAKKLAVDWAKGEHEVLKQFELVIVLKLREVSKKETLKEALKASKLLPIDDPSMLEGLMKYIKENQEKVLFVFDGHDEYGKKGTKEIPQIMKKSRLRNCCVLITTRPWRADELKVHTDVHAKITGFIEEDVKVFCRNFFDGDEEETDALCKYLSHHELMDTAKVPLLLLFYCLLWRERKNKKLPETKTKLYESIVECVLDHNQSRKDTPTTSHQRMEEEEYKEALCLVGEVAFKALKKDSTLFAYEDLPKEVRRNEILQLGFLSATDTQHWEPSMKVSFLHKSLQEFLAAWYVTKSEGTDFLESLNGMDDFNRLSDFLVFVCGLSVDDSTPAYVFQRLKETVYTEEPSLDWETCDDANDLLWEHMENNYGPGVSLDPLFRLFQAVRPEAQVLGKLLHCTSGVLCVNENMPLKRITQAIEMAPAEEKSLIKEVRFPDDIFDKLYEEKDENLIKLMTLLDVTVKTSSQSGGIPASDFVKSLMDLYSSCDCSVGELSLYKSGENINMYFHKLELSCDSHAKLLVNHDGNDRSTTTSEWNDTCLVFLVDLKLTNIGGEETESDILGCLKHLPSLTHLKLDENPLGKRVVGLLAEYLQYLPRLHTLILRKIGIGETEMETIAQTFPHVPCLEYLNLSDNPMGNSVAELFRRMPQLLTLDLRNINMTEAGVATFAEVLPCLPHLDDLELAYNPSLGESAGCLIRHVPALERLNLACTGMTKAGLKVLAENLQHVRLLRELNLSGNNLGGEIGILASNLNYSNLRMLNLSRSGLTSDNLNFVCEILKHSGDLTSLFLDGNQLGESAGRLIDYFRYLPYLLKLSLKDCGIPNKTKQSIRNAYYNLARPPSTKAIMKLYF